MRSKLLISCSIASVFASMAVTADDYFPPIDAFEKAPYTSLSLGTMPEFNINSQQFPYLKPGDVIAFYVDKDDQVHTLNCQPSKTQVTSPLKTASIEGISLDTGDSSISQSIAIVGESLDTGSQSASASLSTESYSAENDTSSSSVSLSVATEQVAADTSSQQSEVEVTTDGIESQRVSESEQISVSETISVKGYRSSISDASIQEVFAINKGLSQYIDEELMMEMFDSELFSGVLQDDELFSAIYDANELALINDAKQVWLERVQRFNRESLVLDFLVDLPTDAFRQEISGELTKDPEVSCSYQGPKDSNGVNYGHLASVRFELNNPNEVEITDLLVVTKPSDNTSYVAAFEEETDPFLTRFIPSEGIVMHRFFGKVPANATYRNQFVVETARWELPEPPKEKKGWFGF